MNDSKPVAVNILDKEYLISCNDEEREQLHTAVTFLNMKMKEVKDSGKVIGSERVAVMTALNISHELLAYKRHSADYTTTIDKTIQRLKNKLDDALTNGKQLEIHQ
ncbi:MAG: cell division protein ZapA [Gammaproteobacteria bacterium]|nr:cell division protein ZapA [Gammaproteobacteria bacterium]